MHLSDIYLHRPTFKATEYPLAFEFTTQSEFISVEPYKGIAQVWPGELFLIKHWPVLAPNLLLPSPRIGLSSTLVLYVTLLREVQAWHVLSDVSLTYLYNENVYILQFRLLSDYLSRLGRCHR